MEPVVETLMREIAEKVASCDFVKGLFWEDHGNRNRS